MRKCSMIYTPNRRIPVGEVTVSKNGNPVLLVKKRKSTEVDEIPLDDLIRQVMNKTEAEALVERKG